VKLAELDPRWLTPEVLVFNCPACSDGGRLSLKSVPMGIWDQIVLFRDKLGSQEGRRVHPCNADQAWTFSGTDFATLSATPSLNVEGHWHHTITNGEIA
jgi:hypothetical protein